MIANKTYSRDQKEEYKCENCKKSYIKRISSHKKSLALYGKCFCRSCASSISAKRRYKDGTGHKVTKTCKNCQKIFQVEYVRRSGIYCSKSCQAKAVSKSDSRYSKKCIICGKDFKTYDKNANHCSRECTYITSSKARMGKGNPAWKNYRDLDKSICKGCGKEFRYTRNGIAKNRKKVFCSKECQRGINTKGITINKKIIEQYPKEFRKIKKTRKNIDKNKCAFCNSKNNLEVHHIDYNKQNCNIKNLLTLCKRCHTITHHSREFWREIIENLFVKYSLRKKSYGIEFCDKKTKEKFLVLFKHYKFKLRYAQNTTWEIIGGQSNIINKGRKIFFNKNKRKINFKPKEFYHIIIKRHLIVKTT